MSEYSKETVLKTVAELFDMVKEQQSEITQLKAQLIDQGQRFNDQSQKVRDLEFKCEGLEKRTTDATKHLNDVRNKGMDQSCYLALKALRGGDQNTKNSIQVIESNANRGGDQNGEH